MYHKLTVYVKSRYQTNIFPSCCFGDQYHKYKHNSIKYIADLSFFTHCITTCFIDARHRFNIIIFNTLSARWCNLFCGTNFQKNHIFIGLEKNHAVRLSICIKLYGTKCCVVQHEGMCSFSFMLI